MQGRSDVLGEPLEALASRWLAGPQRPCVCQNHVSDASIVCAGPTCLASPRRCCLRRTHVPVGVHEGPVCARPMRLARPQSGLDPRAWRVHSSTLLAGPTCLAGPHWPCVRQSQVLGWFTKPLVALRPGAWRVHSAVSAARSTCLTVSRASSAGSTACLGDFTTWRSRCLGYQIRKMIKSATEINDESLQIWQLITSQLDS